MSDAAGTLWLDVANRQWFSPMLRATGLALEQMPGWWRAVRQARV
jgi:xylulokinase